MTENIQWAYVCGAYPDRFRTIQARLQKIGINVSGHCDSARNFEVPKHTTFILLITDQVSHEIANKARGYAANSDISLIAGNYKNWMNVEARILERGFSKFGELVAGGQEVIPEQSKKDTFANKLDPHKLEELKQELVQPAVINTPIIPEDPMVTKILPKTESEKSLRKVFDSYSKEELKTTINEEIMIKAKENFGLVYSASSISKYRNLWKYTQVPKGFKKNKRGTGIITRSKLAVAKITVPPIVETKVSGSPQKDLDDLINSLLKEIVTKNNINKLYISFENGKFESNFEVFEIKTYSKKY